jgi:hypothetical protein
MSGKQSAFEIKGTAGGKRAVHPESLTLTQGNVGPTPASK